MIAFLLPFNALKLSKIDIDDDSISYNMFFQYTVINRKDILDFTEVYFEARKMICIRYTDEEELNTLIVSNYFGVEKIKELLNTWGISESNPKNMMIAVPSDSGKRLHDISKCGIIGIFASIFIFICGTIFFETVVNSQMLMLLSMTIGFLGLPVSSTMISSCTIWAMKNGVLYGKPLKTPLPENNGKANSKINIIAVIVAVICAVNALGASIVRAATAFSKDGGTEIERIVSTAIIILSVAVLILTLIIRHNVLKKQS